ncbi:hypothetical protein CJF42_26110 [Pseudoalteromonas sp. NBT06-2]|uniref:hypothetical protein n=1 Tax=Pseudoalteromonas sp. NBT06-2 TaxID=2025950 RepID=UPI000BA556BC|nr:hypothetical protein [Pseudoalteromonas sp. NBT06-2]PAJ70116.1 hypothetical protein CJF42_26110 [Pseudoalteromonas sp. NBT06-2]
MFCALENQDGSYQLEQVINPNDCTGLLLNEGADLAYWIRYLVDPNMFTSAEYAMLFMAGLSTILISYLVSWGYGEVINFLNQK